MDRIELAAMIDQTLLRREVGPIEARAWIEQQSALGFATLCVSPFAVPIAAEVLSGTVTRACSVVAFPFGFTLGVAKADEARRLVAAGALEIDMVCEIGALREGDESFVRDDIGEVVRAVEAESSGKALTKVILETGLLDNEHTIRLGCRLAAEAGARFVKTSTGFGPRGASVDDVLIMRSAVGSALGVKAAGSIRDLASALAMIEAGADRIGTSSGLGILTELDASRAAD